MRKRVGMLLAFLVIGAAVVLGAIYAQTTADFTGQDRQPIAFSHQRHAGNCRSTVSSAIAAPASPRRVGPFRLPLHDLPSLPERADPGDGKAAGLLERQGADPWIRLQRLPDFVQFTHEMHLDAGFQCADCHGEVERMSQTPRAATFEMGWCIDCHERNGASLDCFTCHY